jgi:hypothetical protein
LSSPADRLVAMLPVHKTYVQPFAASAAVLYADRGVKEGWSGAKSGSVTVIQRTSADLRLNPHLHLVALDGAYHEQGAGLVWHALGHLKTSEVGELVIKAVPRPPLIVIEPEFALQFFIIALDAPAQLAEPHQRAERCRGR